MIEAIPAATEVAGQWRHCSPAARAAALEAGADALESARAELVELADEETHLGHGRLGGELTRTTFQLRMFAEQVRDGGFLDVRIDRAEPQWPSGPRPELRRYRTALGPVLVFAASNFPFAFSVAGGDTASALAAGCPVVVKAHPGHPRLSRRVAEIMQEALGPAGLLGLIEGEQTGVDALRHPDIQAAAFTGSVRGGLALSQVAAQREQPIPFYGELGSVNPIVVTPAAAAAREGEIAEGYVGSLTQGAGQFCTNPGLLFVPEASRLVDTIANSLGEVGAAPMLNDRIAEGYVEGAERLARQPGMRTLVWLHQRDSLAPRLLGTDLAEFTANPEAAQECFGPVGLAVTYRSLAELTPAIAALPGQLTTTLHAEHHEAGDIAALAETLAGRSGRVLWNGWPTGVAVTSAMQHGGPYPATTNVTTTSVGTAAIERFLRPVTFQSWPQDLLPKPLRDNNPWNVPQHSTSDPRKGGY